MARSVAQINAPQISLVYTDNAVFVKSFKTTP